MHSYVAVTDPDWYRFLSGRRDLEEVNFWRPKDTRHFGAIAVGEPFFFKTHAPHNRVVGGGFYSSSANLRLSEAWEWFGPANGVASLAEMRARIARYRPLGPGEDPRHRVPVHPRPGLLPRCCRRRAAAGLSAQRSHPGQEL